MLFVKIDYTRVSSNKIRNLSFQHRNLFSMNARQAIAYHINILLILGEICLHYYFVDSMNYITILITIF